jgi:hypothetical protein
MTHYDKLKTAISRFDNLLSAFPLLNKKCKDAYESLYTEAIALLDDMAESEDEEFIIENALCLTTRLNKFVDAAKRYISDNFNKKKKKMKRVEIGVSHKN